MITTQELEHLAELARIKLDDADKQSFLSEFDSILDYIDQLKKVKVELDTESRLGEVRNIMRPDVADQIGLDDRERILTEAPEREGDHIAVKKIIAQD